MTVPAVAPAFDYEIRCRDDVAEGTLSIPERSDWWSLPSNVSSDIVRVDVGGRVDFLRATQRKFGQSNEALVVCGTSHQLRLHRLRTSTDGRLALFGLALAIIAEGIKLSLTIGQSTPLVAIGAVGVSVLNVQAVLLTAIGLVLVVWKRVLAARG
ncbi:hypothetical protein [Cryobacterium luteum]|uniref:Uncharacterized protein n=1 Tax=Cryobacterium luteum TaxID=1424661 RepID=A0A1H8JB80_9MICO|nr:hypothetical protein [Cryobacterium luteum]TFB92365.1 hypothetical protein E3O10_04815 [Cryobacterium luteum]SEN77368.1 hypothetical protein SAMN05216281_1143 [Cryobacterium luteum]